VKPRFFIREGETMIPYSIDRSAHLCSSCLELFHVLGEEHKKKLVAPCPVPRSLPASNRTSICSWKNHETKNTEDRMEAQELITKARKGESTKKGNIV